MVIPLLVLNGLREQTFFDDGLHMTGTSKHAAKNDGVLVPSPIHR